MITTLLCMVLAANLGIWLGVFPVFLCSPVEVTAASDMPDTPARSVLLNPDENSLAVLSRKIGMKEGRYFLYVDKIG